VKSQRQMLAAAVASPADFKGGKYGAARDACGTIALMLGLIDAYDGEARWKGRVAGLRDACAQTAAACEAGTAAALAGAVARASDLERLLSGAGTDDRSGEIETLRWSQLAGRPTLMGRLEAAEALLAADAPPNARQWEQLRHEVEIVAVIGEVIQFPGFLHRDEEGYRTHAGAMRDAARQAREELEGTPNQAGLRSAVGALRKSCDACHAEYR